MQALNSRRSRMFSPPDGLIRPPLPGAALLVVQPFRAPSTNAPNTDILLSAVFIAAAAFQKWVIILR